MSEAQKTSIQFLYLELAKFIIGKSEYEDSQDIVDIANEMHKKEVTAAHISAGARLEDISIESADNYYNKTFGGGNK
jgi:hypothetical protein